MRSILISFYFNFLGVASVGIGSIDAAVKYYKEALSLNPQYYEVYNNIGLAYNDLKKPNVAKLMKKLKESNFLLFPTRNPIK